MQLPRQGVRAYSNLWKVRSRRAPPGGPAGPLAIGWEIELRLPFCKLCVLLSLCSLQFILLPGLEICQLTRL